MEAALNSPLGRTPLGPAGLRIGRSADNQLVINDLQASSHHVQLAPGPNGDSYLLTDLNSTNGTYVNEQRLLPNTPRPLNPGDVIRIGSTHFTYEATAASSYDPTIAASPSGYEATMAASPDAFSRYDANAQQAYPQPAPPQSPSGYGNYGAPGIPPQQPFSSPSYPQQGYPQPGPAYPQQPYPQAGYPQQGYPQPAYPQAPGQFGAPGFPPPAPPQKKSRVGLWIGLIILIVLILGGVGAFAVSLLNRSTPEKTLQAYCTALKNSDAQGVFNQLSNRAQAQTSVAKIQQAFQAIAIVGGIKDCTFSNVQQNGSTATATVTITVGSGRSQPTTGPLVLENNVWKIDDNTNGTGS